MMDAVKEKIAEFMNQPWIITLIAVVVIGLYILFYIIYLRRTGKLGKITLSQQSENITSIQKENEELKTKNAELEARINSEDKKVEALKTIMATFIEKLEITDGEEN